MSDTEWTSPRKMMDYYMDQSDGIGCHQGRGAGASKGPRACPEWLKQIEALKYDDPFTLPPDLELSTVRRQTEVATLVYAPARAFLSHVSEMTQETGMNACS
jgi:hypothetical protein